jgi:hypothetical protein
MCRDGELDAGEQCEDGNDTAGDTVAGDTCTDCKLEGKACGDGELSPGEDCDGGPNCTACAINQGTSCLGAVPLPNGIIPSTALSGTAAVFGNLASDFGGACAISTQGPTQVWRFDTGAFPEGFFIRIDNSSGSEARLFSYAGCGSFPLGCDTEFSSNQTELWSPVLPPKTTAYVGFTDRYGAALTYQGRAYRYRYGTTFPNDADGWTLSGWSYESSYEDINGHVFNTTTEQSATSPTFYVGGLGPKAYVTLSYGTQGDANVVAKVYVSFDGGAEIEKPLPLTNSQTVGSSLDFDRPPNTETMTVRAGISHPSGYSSDLWLSSVAVGATAP